MLSLIRGALGVVFKRRPNPGASLEGLTLEALLDGDHELAVDLVNQLIPQEAVRVGLAACQLARYAQDVYREGQTAPYA